MVSLQYILILLSSLLYLSVNGHFGCGADKITNKRIHKNWNVKPKEPSTSNDIIYNDNYDENNPQKLDMEARANGDPDGTNTYSNIRIAIDTSTLEDNWSDDEDLLEYFVDDVIPAAIEWIEAAFSVRPGLVY